MRLSLSSLTALLASFASLASAWVATPSVASTSQRSSTALDAASPLDRRNFGQALVGAAVGGLGLVLPANAQVFMDPAQYGDQELRVGAVDSLREAVRRAILKKPSLAPSFYQLALLDGLSFDGKTQQFGPDSSIIKVVLSSKQTDDYTKNLQACCLALVEAEKILRKKTAITLADAVAIGGAEAIESIGGPILTVQLGRADAPLDAKVSNIPIDLFKGDRSTAEMVNVFQRAGVTDREMVSLLVGLMTLETIEKTRTTEDWKASAKPKFREQGKMGRMSEFRRLTEEDIEEAEAQALLEADPEYEDPDDGWYIADSFGTKDDRFGERLAKGDINAKTFNKYVKTLLEAQKAGTVVELGWIAVLLSDPDLPTAQSWLQKYGASNINYVKDLSNSFNAVTQLGAVYTGGKYENLLKTKTRKSLNNDDLNLF